MTDALNIPDVDNNMGWSQVTLEIPWCCIIVIDVPTISRVFGHKVLIRQPVDIAKALFVLGTH